MSFSSSSGVSRRRFVQGLAVGGVATAFGWPRSGLAAPAPMLAGTDFDLVIDELPVNFTGRSRIGIAVNGSVPAPTLRWREGTTVELRVQLRGDGAESIE